MKMINVNNGKININNIKIIILMTIIILVILILFPMMLLRNTDKKSNGFSLNDNDIIKSSQITFPADGQVKLYRKSEDKVENIYLDDYIMGVVASEMPADFNEEAIKAQAVAARTFYMSKRINPNKEEKEKGAEICDTTHCQVYMSKEERLSKWSKKDSEVNWNKISKAVLDTEGQVLTYNGEILEYPQFFAISSGKTEAAEDVFSFDVPYLKSEESKGEEIAPKYKTSTEVKIDDFINKIKSKYKDININKNNLSSIIKIDSYTTGGSVKEIKIGSENIKGTDFRKIFNLNSSNFVLDIQKDKIVINCTGYGHGVGMSQWGANVMAKNGYMYDEILKHYYNGIEIQKINYN